MTLIFVKDEKRTIKSLCAMIDNAPRMDVFKLEELELDGTKGNIIVLSKALRAHPCLEEFNITSVTLTDATLSLDQVVSMILVSVHDVKHIKMEKVPISAGSCNSTSLETPIVPKSTLDSGVSDLGCDAFATAKDKNSVIQTVHLEGGGEISCEQRSQVKRAGTNAHAA
jgi:hypothetical protein